MYANPDITIFITRNEYFRSTTHTEFSGSSDSQIVRTLDVTQGALLFLYVRYLMEAYSTWTF